MVWGVPRTTSLLGRGGVGLHCSRPMAEDMQNILEYSATSASEGVAGPYRVSPGLLFIVGEGWGVGRCHTQNYWPAAATIRHISAAAWSSSSPCSLTSDRHVGNAIA